MRLRGDLALVDLAPARRAEADATRPAILVTNHQAPTLALVLAVALLTSHTERVHPMRVANEPAWIETARRTWSPSERLRKALGCLPTDLLGCSTADCGSASSPIVTHAPSPGPSCDPRP
ncbi:MAG TPA: type II toxin-antitoxin system PemK/MazF family toxin [Trueperaceae bacterium]